jgi:hypothetical protein
MTQVLEYGRPTVAAYITFGNRKSGICKELSFTLQIRAPKMQGASKIVRFIRPVNRQAPLPCGRPDQ